MPQLRGAFIGKPIDFRPSHYPSRKELISVVGRQLPPGVERVLFTRINGTGTNLLASQDDFSATTPAKWFLESKDTVDGAVIYERRSAIFIANADCPLMVVRSGEKLMVLHCAFRCLVGENGESIIIKSVRPHFPNPLLIDNIFFGFGAGPCCFGQEESLANADIRKNVPAKVVQVATHGPRAGSPSINLCNLAMLHLGQVFMGTAGFREATVRVEGRCTACAGRDGGQTGLYWSHVWDGRPVPGKCEAVAGRNGAFFWLE